jgi:tetratricopeptide (TPR) repeat protein
MKTITNSTFLFSHSQNLKTMNSSKKISLFGLCYKLLYTKSIAALFAAAIIGMITASSLAAQPTWQKTQYQAYLKSDVRLWHQSMKEVATTNDAFTKSLAGYGLLNATMANQNEAMFDEYLDETYNPLEAIVESKKGNVSESKALLSSIMGYKMGYSPWKGIYLGSKSSSYVEEALKANPESYIVQKMYAISKFYTPETFGGDVKVAAMAFEKSIALMESNPELTKENWQYLDALAHLGKSYMKLNQKEKAIATFEKALETEPQFLWVSQVLLPNAKGSN